MNTIISCNSSQNNISNNLPSDTVLPVAYPCIDLTEDNIITSNTVSDNVQVAVSCDNLSAFAPFAIPHYNYLERFKHICRLYMCEQEWDSDSDTDDEAEFFEFCLNINRRREYYRFMLHYNYNDGSYGYNRRYR